ncbi:MAG: hypothetical protein IPM23_25955 [Candidatus Melainabacteria bacterium]|nr:hypothetical protein [Candidatus Melainabacteria bacterium]
MGSYAVLSVGGYELYCSKNTFDEWLFKKGDRKIEQHRHFYETSISTLRKRLELSGTTLAKAQREFDVEITERIALIEKFEGEVLDENEKLDVDLATLKSATFAKWLPKLEFIIQNKLTKTDEYEECEDRGCPILNILLRTPCYQQYQDDEFLRHEGEFLPVNWPCQTIDSFARALVEITDQKSSAVLDITDLVEGGWANEFEDLAEHQASSTRIFEYFEQAVFDIETLLSLDEKNQTLLRLLHANAITAMETYLGDTIRKQVLSRPALMRRFVETNTELREKKFPVAELFNVHDLIRETVADLLDKTVFHHLERVIGLYKNVLHVEFPQSSIGLLVDAVATRHDIVHRNGKTISGKAVSITPESLKALLQAIFETMKYVDKQVQDGLLDEVEIDDEPVTMSV